MGRSKNAAWDAYRNSFDWQNAVLKAAGELRGEAHEKFEESTTREQAIENLWRAVSKCREQKDKAGMAVIRSLRELAFNP